MYVLAVFSSPVGLPDNCYEWLQESVTEPEASNQFFSSQRLCSWRRRFTLRVAFSISPLWTPNYFSPLWFRLAAERCDRGLRFRKFVCAIFSLLGWALIRLRNASHSLTTFGTVYYLSLFPNVSFFNFLCSCSSPSNCLILCLTTN